MKPDSVISEIANILLGKEFEIELLVSAWIAQGHVLLEDVPGTGKTLLAKSLARVCQLDFKRVQFTPDLLPNDLIGTPIYSQAEKKFVLNKGPLFTSIFLGDELNRASPRTQSALLEAMGESQISIEKAQFSLPQSFFVMATQNPLEHQGTFALPEAQLDRFLVKMAIGLPSRESEAQLLRGGGRKHQEIASLKPKIQESHLLDWRKKASESIYVDQKIYDYVLDIVEQTRLHQDLELGSGPRGSLGLIQLAKALSFVRGEHAVMPSTVYELAPYVLAHRLVLSHQARYSGKNELQILGEVLKRVNAPTDHEIHRARTKAS